MSYPALGCLPLLFRRFVPGAFSCLSFPFFFCYYYSLLHLHSPASNDLFTAVSFQEPRISPSPTPTQITLRLGNQICSSIFYFILFKKNINYFVFWEQSSSAQKEKRRPLVHRETFRLFLGLQPPPLPWEPFLSWSLILKHVTVIGTFCSVLSLPNKGCAELPDKPGTLQRTKSSPRPSSWHLKPAGQQHSQVNRV